jgi:hypothetical protein
MSDLASVASINVNITGDGDPARGGSDTTMQSVLETLRHIQVNVGSINGNVRAILETLRVLARSGRAAGGGGGGGAGGGGGGGGGGGRGGRPRAGDEPASGFAASVLEYRNRMTRTPGLRFSDIGSEAHRGLLARYHDEAQRASMTRNEMREALSLRRVELFGESQQGRISAETAREIYRREAAAQRDAMRNARTDQMAGLRAARNRMSSAMQERIDVLRRQRESGATAAFNDEERAILSGQVSPSGLPGTRAYARQVRDIARPPAAPGAQPAAPTFMERAGGFLRVFGRVLAIGQMLVNIVRRIGEMIKRIVDSARATRAAYAMVDAPTAMMQAQVQIAQFRDNIILARASRNTSAGFPREELLNIETTRFARYLGRSANSVIGAGLLRVGSNLGLLSEGLAGNGQAFAAGMVGMMGYTPIGALVKSLFPQIDAAYNAYINGRINQARATVNGVFIDDLSEMTAGRFDPDRAYPSMRGGNRRPLATANNWWEFRP